MSDLATTSQLEDISKNGAQILEINTLRAEKAVTVGKNILTVIEENGMSPELDERANKYLVNVRTAKSEMEVSRKPITAFFDTIRKQFTEAEAKLDVTKPETVAAKIQNHRNAYVKALKDADDKKKKEAQDKLDKDNEIIEIKASFEKQLSEYIQNHILTRKQNLQNGFNAITLDTFDEKSKGLKALKPEYKVDHYKAFSPVISLKKVSSEELATLKTAFDESKDFSLIAAVVESDLAKFKVELVEKLPSLKTQLQKIADADKEEQTRLANQKLEREQQEQADLQKQSAEAIKSTEESIEMNKVSEQTEAMMENLTVSGDNNTPENRSGFDIKINHPAGVVEIFNFWFQKEGCNLAIPDLEKKTIKQMKTFCENLAHKSDEKIVNSKFLTYEPVYKAVNRK